MSLYLGNKPIANDGLQRLTGEIGDMGFAPLGIDESLNLRRYLNGQVISQIQFEAFTTKVKSAVALFPSLATTESNWQAEKALSKFGQVGKFVIDDENQTIRLPAVVNAQGLLGLSGIGGLVNESLPNITGDFSQQARGEDIEGNAFYSGSSGYAMIGSSWGTGDRTSFNASRSSSTYQDSAPVQQEAIQYPYYIQVATGIEETLPAIREYEINTPFFFGWSMYSENAPYNASLLASQGQYNASNLYPDLWSQLQVELNASLNVGDIVEIDGKTYVKRGLSVVLSTGTITDYDFVVDLDNSQFRLPLLNGSEDLPGDRYENWNSYVTGLETDLPEAPANGYVTFSGNGTATVGYLYVRDTQLNSGAGQTASTSFRRDWVQVKKGDVVHIYINNVSGVGSLRFIYATGNGTLYYYVGDVVQDASLVNAGAVLTTISKLLTLSNITAMNCFQTTDSTKVGYIFSTGYGAGAVNVYAPSGGKWLILELNSIFSNSAVIYQFGDDVLQKHYVGEIVDGGTQVFKARNGYSSMVTMLKIA